MAETVASVLRRMVREAGSIRALSRRLGVSRGSLYRWMDGYLPAQAAVKKLRRAGVAVVEREVRVAG